MSTNEQTPLSQPTPAMQNTLGKEQISQDMDMPASDAALREYCDRNYHQLLPIIAKKSTKKRMRDLRKRLGFRRLRSVSESPEPRCGRPESPRKKDPERKTVFNRLEKGVFHRLGDKRKSISAYSNDSRRQSYHSSRRDTEICYQSSHSRGTELAYEKHHNKTTSSHRKEALSESKEEEEGAEGPMIIEAEIRGHFIHQMYVDGGSGSKILYEHCFNRLCQEIKNQMVLATPLIGLSGEIIWPLGQLSLLVKIRDKEHSTSAWMNFVVVRSSSPYNGIIRRLSVKKIQAVSSTAYGMLKFHIGGVLTLRSSKIIPIECSTVSGPEGQPPTAHQDIEERIKVAINPDYPEQTIIIGFTLTKEGRNKLCNLLQRNLYVFAWKPADMTRVPRHVVEHRLNIREGCPLVRQKRRSQAADRNQAIQEEVEKLVDSYHQIKMAKEDEAKTTFIISQGVFCYYKMPFGLRNARATYQRLVDKAFHKQIGRNLEVYVDVLVIKSRTENKIARDIEETFKTMREINMKLNPKKYFRGRRRKSDFHWTEESKAALKQMKELIAELPTLTTSEEKEELIIYLATTKEAQKICFGTGARQQTPKKILPSTPTYSGHVPAHKAISVKGQILANFIVERLEEDDPDTAMKVKEELLKPWILFTDGSSCVDGSRAGLILTNLEGQTEIGMPTLRTSEVDMVQNSEALGINLDLLEERREQAVIREAKSKAKMEKYYNSKVRSTSFKLGYLVYRSIDASHVEEVGKLGPKWEGPALIRACQDCQVYKPIIRNLQQKLTPITSPWTFYKWGIDIAGAFLEGPSKVKFLIVSIDYFTN
nr:reverse transcriptase domain-containing protein [Tanacetum cinerariifolium]